jgi:integrase/recombinase XerD
VSALVDAYLAHLAVERRLSPNTVESYGRDLAQLSAAAAALERPVDSLDRRALEQVVRHMMGEGRSPRSVARAVACFRGFYRFLVISGRRADNPAVDVRAPRAWKALPKFLSTDEVDRLLDAPDTTEPRGVRDRALIELFYATGLRVSEMVSLRQQDLNLEGGYLTCTGKGRKQRLVPIGDAASAWLTRYLQEGRPALLKRKSSSKLFVNARGGGRQPHPRRLLEDPEGTRPARRFATDPQPACAAPFVRHALAGARRRLARDPDDARS